MSIDYGVCFYCRNYKKIELKRLIEWRKLWDSCVALPERNRIEMITKRSIAKELHQGRNNYIKYGFMIPPNRSRQQEKIDSVAIQIAMRDPRIESKIIWAKYNKVGNQ